MTDDRLEENMNKVMKLLGCLVLLASVSACVVAPPPAPHPGPPYAAPWHGALWVPGHYGPGGAWINGHWR